MRKVIFSFSEVGGGSIVCFFDRLLVDDVLRRVVEGVRWVDRKGEREGVVWNFRLSYLWGIPSIECNRLSYILIKGVVGDER